MMSTPFIEDNDQTRARREHLESIRELVGNVYPNKFERSNVTAAPGGEDTITSLVEKFAPLAPARAEGERPAAEELERANAELNKYEVRVAGRLAVPPRIMGKAAFVHLSDGRERLQIYIRRDDVREMRGRDGRTLDGWRLFQLLDHGDFIGVEGFLFVTKTGELSIHVRSFEFLSKALLPMPDKMHGISDPEIRQRRRYADLIAAGLTVRPSKKDDKAADSHSAAAPEEQEAAAREEQLNTREVFERRSRLIRELRRFLDDNGYIEVETPMLTSVASGAAARPFVTHHNALDIDLYLRIAPELYLKRLLVGGFERVYELNRNFRNEGIGYRWNPEFTMLEFYCAYMDVNGMMDFCEEMLRATIEKVTGGTTINYDNHKLDFGRKFRRLTMSDAIAEHWSSDYDENFNRRWLDDIDQINYLTLFFNALEKSAGFKEGIFDFENFAKARQEAKLRHEAEKVSDKEFDEAAIGRNIAYIFEMVAERHLVQPTFIYNYPKPISPLSKASPEDPTVAERFELFINGMEIGNGFSELNDPVEQYERFEEQVRQRERGDDEAMQMDTDYVRALSYGMPPAAGIGIGVDRLTMLLTNRRSIRDVILFPHMRPQRQAEEAQEADGGQEKQDAG